ncbi:phosphotransferase [Georgenia sp. MJ170]|uniref:phosphotransferase n=1 Tax=Georgenia sunbinii TaxID=3117728 RepID=UPI002F26CECB
MTAVASADQRLAAADPAVPGLAEVLRPLDLVQRLAPGWGAVAARVTYLRYKPGTSLVAGLVLTADDGATVAAQALALGPAAPDKLTKVRRAGEADDVGLGAVLDPRLGVALTDVTADRHLPGVRRVLRHADRTTSPLVYKPGRRWVARQDRTDAPPSLVKVHRPATLPGLLAGYHALRGLPVSRVTSVHQRRGVVTSAWLPGTPLDRLAGDGVADLWARAGGVLADVHRQPATDGLAPVDRAAGLAAAVAAVRSVAPELAAEARTVAERVRAGLRGGDGSRVVHGDFSADQVIVRPDLAAAAGATGPGTPAEPGQPAVTVVDLDRVGLDDPVADLASWYGALVAAGAEPGDPRDVLAPLLAGYTAAGGRPCLDRLRLHCAAAVLQRATEPFRQHLPGWPAGVAGLVAVSTRLSA